jgi:hypothetical protein
MNQRFQDLAQRCNKQAKEVYKGDWPYNCAAWTGEELIDFANLIILESCVFLDEEGHTDLAEKLGDFWDEEKTEPNPEPKKEKNKK